jgi:peptidoglycan/xylan/chitin deacetylase (PgdA/CDA1 family)
LRALDNDRLDGLFDALLRADQGRRDRCVVLTYHRVDVADARPWLWPSLLSATPVGFEQQMTLLAERMQPIPVAQLLDALAHGRQLPRRSVAVTIDDAYAGVDEHVLPVLTRLRIPATLFVPTAFPDTTSGFWWDRLYHAITATTCDVLQLSRRGWPRGDWPLEDRAQRVHTVRTIHDWLITLPHADILQEVQSIEESLEVVAAPTGVMDWEQLRGLSRAGLELAPHSHTHARMDRLDDDEADREVRTSVERIRDEIGSEPTVFAYPAGSWSSTAARAVRDAGMLAAFATQRAGIDLAHAERYRLPRVNVSSRASVNSLRLQLGSWMRAIGR